MPQEGDSMTAPSGEPQAPGAPAAGIPTATTPGAPAPATPPVPATPPAPNPWEGFTWDGNVDALPADVAKAIRDARADAGKARTTAKATAAEEARAALAAQIAETLGLKTAEPPDAATLTQHLQQAQAEAAGKDVELRVWKAAVKAGADADAMFDSVSFLDEINDIEVEPGDFATFDAKVAEVIQKWQAGRSQAAAPPATGRPVTALRPGTLPNPGQPSLDDQIAEAQKAGRMRDVLRLQNQKLIGLSATTQ